MFVSVIIPAYNEQGRLYATLESTAAYFQRKEIEFDISVVDDGSTDSTAQIVHDFAENTPSVPVHLLQYGENRGKGYAVRYGMLRVQGTLRLFCDADLATPPEEFEVILEAMERKNAQIGIGSRPLRESHLLVHQPWYREQLGRGFNKLVQLFAVPGISDTQCGFKIFTAQAAQEVFSRCRIDGFAFDAEALYIARRLGFVVAEVPIRWAHQEGSKLNMMRDGVKMLREIAAIRSLHRDLKAIVSTPVRPPHH